LKTTSGGHGGGDTLRTAWIGIALAASLTIGGDKLVVDNGRTLPAGPFARFTGQDRIELKDSVGVPPLDGSFTVEMWVRWSPYNFSGMNLAGDEAWPSMSADLPVESECGWVLRVSPIEGGDARKLDFTIAVRDKDRTSWKGIVSERCIDASGWHHLAVCKHGDTVTLFWNGEVAARESIRGLAPVASASLLDLGVRKSAHGNRSFHGDVKALRISSKSRYTKKFVPAESFEKDDATLVCLDFSNVKGDEVADTSGHSRAGRLVGARLIKPDP
jgi:hypothetical protein